MVFTNSRGVKWYLHKRETLLPRNKVQAFTYFFRREMKDDYCPNLPEHLKIIETHTGLPLVKKI